MLPPCFRCVFFFILTSVAFGQAPDVASRKIYLEQLRSAFPRSAPFEQWLDKSHELPPDFSKMPSMATLPDPLIGADGEHIATPAEWRVQRERLLGIFKHWYWGKVPEPPTNLVAKTISESVEDTVISRRVLLSFGPDHRASLHVELLLPHRSADHGPFPLFLTQHTQRAWALIAVRRGYAACIYDGSDDHDDTDSQIAAYPDYDFAQLARRAFAASRALDYCLALPEIDHHKIVLTGHSRNAKQSLIAGALDERISIVVVGSSGQGGAAAARYQGEPQSAESIESLTRSFPQWYHPRLRFFSGREDKLPVDGDSLLALIAPRPCLLSTAMNDPYELLPAVQASYVAALPVYRLLDREENLMPLWRVGAHEITPETVEEYLDFCDSHFGRGQHPFSSRLLYPQVSNDNSKANQGTGDFISSLGVAPPHLRTTESTARYGSDPAFVSTLLNRQPTTKPTDYDRISISFGEYLAGDLYTPPDAAESHKKYPAILYLHPFSTSRGYSGSMAMILTLTRHGFVVLAFDQAGHGGRAAEAERFYARNPHWSLLGKMVADSGDALTSLLALPYVDSKHVYAVGYSLGSTVGLHLLRTDERLTGGAFASPSLNAGVNPGGIRLYPLDHSTPPYSISDLVTACQAHPLLLVTPKLDRNIPHIEFGATASLHLTQKSPELFDNFNAATRQTVLNWLEDQAQ